MANRKYSAITEWLNSFPPHQGVLNTTVKDISQLVGGLPENAAKKSWWNNKWPQKRVTQCDCWLTAGWEVEKLPNDKIVFRRKPSAAAAGQ